MFEIGEIDDGFIVRFIPVEPARDEDDDYGYRGDFREQTTVELVNTFNRQRKSAGWVRARAYWLGSISEEFLSRSVDCSTFIQPDGEMGLGREIRLEGETIVQV